MKCTCLACSGLIVGACLLAKDIDHVHSPNPTEFNLPALTVMPSNSTSRSVSFLAQETGPLMLQWPQNFLRTSIYQEDEALPSWYTKF
jgi:hypothetical protein